VATLTTSWKSYASASYSTGVATITFYLEAKYSSQSIANNTTNVQTRLRSAYTKGSSIAGAGYKFTCTYASTVSGSGSWTFENEVITSGSKTVTHKTDGTQTVSLNATAYNKYWNFNKSMSATVTLPSIPRKATVTAAPNFTDEDNPKISYSNPAGNNVTTLQASIYMPDALTALAYYRDIPKTGTSYTFNLTEEERQRLRLNCLNSKSTTVRFYVRTVLGGTNYTSYLARTLTIANANPTFAAAYLDTNPDTIAITGNNQQIIRNQSTLQIDITNAEAKKDATLQSLSVNINGNIYTGTISGTTGTINVGTIDVSGNITATVTLTDSRGNSTSQDLPLEVLDWTLPTANITLERQNNFYSETDITVDANYSSLDGNNTIDIKVRTKKTTDSTYGSYTSLSDNVTTTLTLDNLYEWDVQVLITDRLGSTTYNLTVGKGMPIIYFDRLKRSVGVDCFPEQTESIELSGKKVLTKSDILDLIYPVGSIYISVNQTSPDTLFGGAWERMPTGRVLVAAGGGINPTITTNTYTGRGTYTGATTSFPVGETGGEADHTLSVAEMPKHDHDIYTKTNCASGSARWGVASENDHDAQRAAPILDKGSGAAHNNVQPYYAVYMWKRTA